MEYSDLNLNPLVVIITTVLLIVALRFLPEGVSPTEQPNAPSKAIAKVQVVKSINDVAAVVLIMRMSPPSLKTIAGDGEIRRGNEIYIRAPDSLASQLRISPSSFLATRCIEITPADYGWRIINVYTQYQCR